VTEVVNDLRSLDEMLAGPAVQRCVRPQVVEVRRFRPTGRLERPGFRRKLSAPWKKADLNLALEGGSR
jgi:hypothetical protein